MSYITPSQFRSGLQEAKDYADGIVSYDDTALSSRVTALENTPSGGGVSEAYIRSGSTALSANWLSLTNGGAALTPTKNMLYVIMSSGEYYLRSYLWNGDRYCIAAQKTNAYTTESTITTQIPSTDVPNGTTQTIFSMTHDKYATSLTFSLSGTATTGGSALYLYVEWGGTRTETIDLRQDFSVTRTYDLTQPSYKGKTFSIIINTTNVSQYRVIGAQGSVVQRLVVPKETDLFYNKKSGLLPDSTNNDLSIFTDDGKWTSVSDLIGRSFAANGLVGEVCLYMSPVVPPHFLACDGAQYNADDYPQLFRVLKEVNSSVRSTWGSADWTTTFNVPNIQGEFPRFSGTNSHANQGNGASVGAHQDGTEHVDVLNYFNGSNGLEIGFAMPSSTGGVGKNKSDSITGRDQYTFTNASATRRTNDTRDQRYTSRPTNTSFFGVIRYEIADDASIHGGAPVGTIFPYDGMTAPDGYLLCDGTVYNISAQQELAEHIKKQHGSYNFYGGNGTTTFAVPDLRGEFIRGAGTNSHVNQGNGAGVGVHQDSTEIPNIRVDYSTGQSAYIMAYVNSGESVDFSKADSSISINNPKAASVTSSAPGSVTGTRITKHATRPTNTSYNYIIKSSSFDNKGGENYSLDEKRIGTWIDGKPLYRKVIEIASLPNASTVSYSHNVLNIDKKVSIEGLMEFSTGTTCPLPYIAAQEEDYQVAKKNSVGLRFKSEVIDVITGTDRSTAKGTIFIKYTKTTD